jgi:hypothetical protein
MEPEITPEQGIQGPFANWVTVLFAFIATANVCTRIAIRWGSFDWLSKFLAVVLLLSLVVIPVCTTWSRKGGKKVGFLQFVQFAYIWLLLATWVFAH